MDYKELQQLLQQALARIAALEQAMKNLTSSASIPSDFEQAIRKRLGL